jgi:hypothetical protein
MAEDEAATTMTISWAIMVVPASALRHPGRPGFLR